jgi:hypothetical protein
VPVRWPRFTAEGNALALELWEGLDPKPIAGFGAFRERLSQALAAGYTTEALRRVVGHVEVWSRTGIEMAFSKSGIDPKTLPASTGRGRPIAFRQPPDPPALDALVRAWEDLTAEARELAEAEVRRRHPNATTWGEGLLWRALVVDAAAAAS